jgi:hypothetical protein
MVLGGAKALLPGGIGLFSVTYSDYFGGSMAFG